MIKVEVCATLFLVVAEAVRRGVTTLVRFCGESKTGPRLGERKRAEILCGGLEPRRPSVRQQSSLITAGHHHVGLCRSCDWRREREWMAGHAVERGAVLGPSDGTRRRGRRHLRPFSQRALAEVSYPVPRGYHLYLPVSAWVEGEGYIRSILIDTLNSRYCEVAYGMI